jgi:chemotaxis family two-component system response regulator Rcp1
METYDSSLHPIEILLVEDNPGDSRLAKEALKESKLKNKLYIAEDGSNGFSVQKREIFKNAPT